MSQLYPLKFTPIYKERVWGGNKLTTLKQNPSIDGKKIGESWELSAVKGDRSKVSNGFLKGNSIEEVIEVYMGDLVGEKVYQKFGVEFPLLIKLIDTDDLLSVQVHPNDEVALKRHKAYGKTEMWYVIDCESDSSIYVGFKETISKEIYLDKMAKGEMLSLLNQEKAMPGDMFFIPAGRIHAIGKGILVAEIQQTSDITYRIYDWGRENDPATRRELHTELAVDVIDYTAQDEYKTVYKHVPNVPVNLAECPYFTTNLLELTKPVERDYEPLDSFVIYMCLDGDVDVVYEGGTETMKKGETMLIPASFSSVELNPKGTAKLLEVYIA